MAEKPRESEKFLPRLPPKKRLLCVILEWHRVGYPGQERCPDFFQWHYPCTLGGVYIYPFLQAHKPAASCGHPGTRVWVTAKEAAGVCVMRTTTYFHAQHRTATERTSNIKGRLRSARKIEKLERRYTEVSEESTYSHNNKCSPDQASCTAYLSCFRGFRAYGGRYRDRHRTTDTQITGYPGANTRPALRRTPTRTSSDSFGHLTRRVHTMYVPG